jgi:hypothetical protein
MRVSRSALWRESISRCRSWTLLSMLDALLTLLRALAI